MTLRNQSALAAVLDGKSVGELMNLAAQITRPLTDRELDTLKALPEPGAIFRKAVRGTELVAEGHRAYPELTELERLRLATGSKGWWKQTRLGVIYLRRLKEDEGG